MQAPSMIADIAKYFWQQTGFTDMYNGYLTCESEVRIGCHIYDYGKRIFHWKVTDQDLLKRGVFCDPVELCILRSYPTTY